ncbi:MAG: NAD(P)-binding protein [Gammaproteobacteria bacterium]|nr:NAD(P)-binding protein [Gammaproteobacteria bacterium]
MKKIAIIGSGISGLAAAYILKDKYDISLYEKNNYHGGHARTIHVHDKLDIDTGFIVFNYHTYPHFSRLLKLLDIPIASSNMSFGVSINKSEIEYGSRNLLNLFAQRSNIFRPRFWRMLSDINKFNKASKWHLKNNALSKDSSLRDYLHTLQVGDWFHRYYIIAMGSAIWSTNAEAMYDFPALTFLQFFHNHGLLDIHRPIQWYTIKGGSQVYVKKIIEALTQSHVKFFPEATQVLRNEKISVIDREGKKNSYDKIIFATHSDQALSLLEHASNQEKQFLKSIPYQKNTVILHKDKSFMPKRKSAWSSWIYLSDKEQGTQQISLSYWMNSLQPLNTSTNYFVTLNPKQRPQEDLIIDEHQFEHPQFSQGAITAQNSIEKIQGENDTYYCGAYLRYGFHEDGLQSAVNVAKKLGVEVPW